MAIYGLDKKRQLIQVLNSNIDTQDFKGLGVKLHVNGCARICKVDDLFLYDKEKRQIAHSHCSTNPDELGPAVIEKALMSLYGEHYFLNQNPKSSICQLEILMHMLTGWIPEVVHFSEVRNTESLFRRMQQNFKEGQICLTLVSA